MQLKELDVSGCNLMAGAIPDDLWCLFSLQRLNVSGNNIDCIPDGIIRLSRLHPFMNYCLMLKEIPELPSSLRWIEARGCPLLETLSSDAKHPLWSSLRNCLKSQFRCSIDGGLFPQIAISSEYRSNRWNKFKAGFSSYLRPITKASCGIHLIYAQDHPQQSLQLFNVKRSHDDTEDHPHHKRSKHV
ncbi:hypothetical protein CK203_116062 [Vitis vinifera]|uniref:Uncharacterized protein n=1 Tax=Vitis vinifera TaxID=29760 RepID=A0A438CQA2_VITVI|nr:hypothetical protein CK203_116062 [Vitis vinifera]